jgi:hypothetical protein
MSLYLGATPIANNAVSRNIGEIIQSTIPLTDAGLHLLDGAVINGAGSYAKFVNYIAGLVSNYPDLFTTEANWQSAVTTYGVCGKFVYDSTNNTVRLPKITGFTEGTIDPTTLGNLTQAGLPNITGAFGSTGSGTTATGAFYRKSGSMSSNAAGGSNADHTEFDASRSSSIYGNSTTVQPQAIKVLYYIVIANSVKTNIEVDIDEVMTDLNGKADVDLSNVNVSGTSLASGWSMPSSRYIDLTLGASGSTYTAPANGWVVLNKVAGSDYYFCSLQVKDTSDNVIMYDFRGVYRTSPCTPKIPVLKGQQFTLTYNATGTTNYFRFVYAEGEPNV